MAAQTIDVAAYVSATRAAQGLPPKVTDETTIARLVAIFGRIDGAAPDRAAS